MPAEALIRVGSFAAVLAVMAWCEGAYPRRMLSAPRFRRYLSNLCMAGISTLAARFLLPVLPFGVALYCAEHDYGILRQFQVPFWPSVLFSIAFLDLAIWLQHVAFHRYRPLWRIHRMHHADVDIDASTGVRFHPIEILASFAYRCCLVFLLGAPPEAVLAFDVIINGCAVFNHANVRLPLSVDRWLRLLVVTPDMHRVHHSTNMHEANTNYGFNFPWWDRLFKTYKAQPEMGHKDMGIGLNIFRDAKYIAFLQMLTIPFR